MVDSRLGDADALGMQTFTRDNVQGREFVEWRKKVTTKAVRIDGPFEVETREGTLTCPDGYLAIDAHGWPYPIAADEFEAIYEPAQHVGGGHL